MYVTAHKKWWLFLATALAIMMVDIDVTAANLALSTIAHDLHFGLSTAQWIIDGYMIAAASLMAFGGRLSDILGTRRVFLAGLVVFTLSSLAVGLSIGPLSIIISRIVQGSCIAFTFPVALVVVRQVFPPHQHGFVIGLMVAIAGLSQALGPTVGGVIITLLSWRWIFLLNIPLALLALFMIACWLPKPDALTKEPIPYLGATIFAMGLLALMTAINEITRFGVGSAIFILLMVSALILLALFAVIEWRSTHPVLNLHLFSNRDFCSVNVIRFLSNGVYFVLLFTLSLLLQNFLGFSALHAGYLLLAMTLVCGIASIPAGKLVDKIGPKHPILLGNLLLIVSTLLLSFIQQQGTLFLLMSALGLAGLGIALLIPATGTAVLLSTPREKSGSGMGIFLTNGFIGSSIGVALSGLLLTVWSRHQLDHLLAASTITVTTQQHAVLNQVASGVQRLATHQTHFSAAMLQILQPMTAHAFISSFHRLMLGCGLLLLVSFLAALRLQCAAKGRVGSAH